MDTALLKTYNDKKAEVGISKTRESLYLEMMFIAWALLSTGKRPKLPENLLLQHWLQEATNQVFPHAFLGETIIEIDTYLKELRGCFTFLYRKASAVPDAKALVAGMTDVFRTVPMEQIPSGIWSKLWDECHAAYLKYYHYQQEDPSDIVELVTKLFATLNRENEPKEVFMPFPRTGKLAICLQGVLKSRIKIKALKEDPEEYYMALLYCYLSGVNVAGFEQATVEAAVGHSLLRTGTIGIFPAESKAEERAYQSLIPNFLRSSQVSVVVVPQALLTLRRYKDYRAEVAERSFLRAIVSLPVSPSLFSRARMAILVFDPNGYKDGVLAVSAEDMERDNKRHSRILHEQVDHLVDVIINNKEIAGFSRRINLETVLESHAAININTIVNQEAKKQPGSKDLFPDIYALEQEFAALDDQITEGFNQLFVLYKKSHMDNSTIQVIRENYNDFERIATKFLNLPKSILDKAYWKMIWLNHDLLLKFHGSDNPSDLKEFLKKENTRFLKQVRSLWEKYPDDFLGRLK